MMHRSYRTITASEIEAMREARASGESFRKIGARFKRRPGTVKAALARSTKPESSAQHRSRSPSNPEQWRPAMVLPHVTARPWSRRWYDQCNSAFSEAMAREFTSGGYGTGAKGRESDASQTAVVDS